MLLAMQVALYEGTWEKYHKNDEFAAAVDQSEYFFGEVLRWGDLLLGQGIELNTMETDEKAVNTGDPYAHLFNQNDYSKTPEVLFWKNTLLLMVYSMLYLVCWVEELLTRTGRPVLLVN